MSGIPIYLRHIWVENVKTFTGRAELRLINAKGILPQWTLILGDNGIGKSTLLQLIAWVKPTLSDDGKSENGESTRGDLLITNEENDVLERLVHRGLEQEKIASIEAVFVSGQSLNKPNHSKKLSLCEASITIETNSSYQLKNVTASIQADSGSIFYQEDVIIYAYSASRHLGKQNLNDKSLLDTIPSFIREKTELYDAEAILHSLDYASLKGAANERSKYKEFLERLKQMLATLLPDVMSSDDIDVTPPRILDFNPEGGVVITTKYGKRVPFSDFSLGYRTISSWAIDLAWRLFTRHHASSDDPLGEPGIVLIDELDLHMHPVWQRQVMRNLAATFPHMQFIATAHSPLMVQAAAESNYAVLRFDEEQECVIINNEPTGIDGWRVDQILTSELFGLKSARGEHYDNLVAQREQILSKKRLTKKDREELDNVTNRLAELPTGENPSEMDDRQEIAKLAQRIREGQIRIKL